MLWGDWASGEHEGRGRGRDGLLLLPSFPFKELVSCLAWLCFFITAGQHHHGL